MIASASPKRERSVVKSDFGGDGAGQSEPTSTKR